MRAMDFSTLVGLGAGILLIAVAAVMGGSAAAFFDGPALLIVVGGTAAVTAVSFTVQELANAWRSIVRTFSKPKIGPREAAFMIMKLAERSRKNSVLALQAGLPELQGEPFLKKAVALVRDGTDVDQIEKLLTSELNAMVDRHRKSAAVLRRAAEVSPAMGLIGTLVGLVQMLGRLNDPATIGPAMAVALLTTFWGAVLANMVFTPLANKMERNSNEEALVNSVYTLGAASIGRQENPRHLEALINTLLPPAHRIRYFD
jgi:chemotaxis protein MotA